MAARRGLPFEPPFMQNFNLPSLGAGAGLRHEHLRQILDSLPPFSWFEIITENFLDIGGISREALLEIRDKYPIIAHGVCLSIGSTDALDLDYLKRLRRFLDEFRIPWASDHLCFTMVDHTNLNDLIPLPFTEEAVEHVSGRLRQVQEILERPFLVENVTRYMTVSDRQMSESEFISEVLTRSGCGLLLDVTNVFLNSKMHNFDPYQFLRSIPLDRVGQIHLAGWDAEDDRIIIDSHDAPVPAPVWDLFREAIRLIGPTSVLIEWDNELPPVTRLLEETEIAERVMREALPEAHAVRPLGDRRI